MRTRDAQPTKITGPAFLRQRGLQDQWRKLKALNGVASAGGLYGEHRIDKMESSVHCINRSNITAFCPVDFDLDATIP